MPSLVQILSINVSIIVCHDQSAFSKKQERWAVSQIPHGFFVTELLFPGHTILDPISTAGASTQILLGWAWKGTAWVLAPETSPSSSSTHWEMQTVPQQMEEDQSCNGSNASI